jgi:phage terminase Nu1 subunit (DNA packaging protein)
MRDDERFDVVPRLGGARRGAGRKAGKVGEDVFVEYSKARARLEEARANLGELDYRIKSGQYVARAAVRQAAATAFATAAQAIRSIPDNLERRLAIEPALAASIEEVIDETLAEVSASLAMMSGSEM